MRKAQLQSAILVIAIATVVIGVILISRCSPQEPPTFESPPPQYEAQAATQPYTISQSYLTIYYTDTITVTVPSDTYPLTMTCELRPGGGLPAIARQVFTWTVGCAAEYSPDPVVAPLRITWELTKPLDVGWYEEFCKTEIPGPHYGWLPGQGQDGDNFFMVNRWEWGYKCYAPLIMKRSK